MKKTILRRKTAVIKVEIREISGKKSGY